MIRMFVASLPDRKENRARVKRGTNRVLHNLNHGKVGPHGHCLT